MRRCSLARQLTTNGLGSISNYASLPEARLLQSQGARPARAISHKVQVWPVHERYVFSTSIFLYRGLPRGLEEWSRRTHTSSSAKKFSILPQFELFLFPRVVLPPT